ncbi:PglL family O-oligosaccharyltransferase [Rahnella selenatireducens]|uniref:PglL family O-oligosaccharyltransferase n=1 Tax=Rahnella selenatireducens TaxID=3389797 RepID=UPI003969B94C
MSALFLFSSRANTRINAGVSLLLFIWFCGGLNCVLPNHGGAGLSLPQNLLAWAVMAIIALWCIYHLTKRCTAAGKITLPPGTCLVMGGVVLWSIPLLWSPRADWQLNALPKVLALWGMAAFYVLLLGTTSCRRLRSRWLTLLVIAALIQAFDALWQLKDFAELPRGRPYGSFQQTNVLASFLATGLACALWLFLQQGKRLTRVMCGTALFALPAVMVFLQSRAGNIGAILATVLLLSLTFAQKKKQSLLAVLIMAAGAGTGLFWLYNGHLFFPFFTPAIKESSTLSRWNMLKLTGQMILLHPLAGNGYGGFESVYGALAKVTGTGLDNDTIQYPHNEFLYAWAEGGLPAVFGILLMVAGVFKRLWAQGGTRLVGVALLLPIAVHMNLEYPLYQSATHGLTIIMLLVVCGSSAESLKDERQKLSTLWRSTLMLIPVGVLIFMLTGLQTQQQLTLIEQQGLLPFVFSEQSVMDSLLNPYSQHDRVDFDQHIALLVRFNQTKDPALLESFSRWAEVYLQVHNDPAVYASLLMIARAQGFPSAERICQEAKARWASDPRFICEK